MKLTQNKKLKQGMTLIELTVVILVLLTLISVLFIGAQAYKNAADRSACILNIRNLHQGMRAYQNTEALNSGDPVTQSDWIGANLFVEVEPTCPKEGGSYTILTAVPAVGTAAATCDDFGTLSKSPHAPKSVAGW